MKNLSEIARLNSVYRLQATTRVKFAFVARAPGSVSQELILLVVFGRAKGVCLPPSLIASDGFCLSRILHLQPPRNCSIQFLISTGSGPVIIRRVGSCIRSTVSFQSGRASEEVPATAANFGRNHLVSTRHHSMPFLSLWWSRNAALIRICYSRLPLSAPSKQSRPARQAYT